MQVDLASAFSAGLLAGAALGVILPEGFESFSRAQAEGQCQAFHAHMRLSEGLTGLLCINQCVHRLLRGLTGLCCAPCLPSWFLPMHTSGWGLLLP